MRRVIGPLPPEQGQSLEDMIDHDRSTMAAWCQRSGMGAHGPPAVELRHPTQLCINCYTHMTRMHTVTFVDVRKHVKCPVQTKQDRVLQYVHVKTH